MSVCKRHLAFFATGVLLSPLVQGHNNPLPTATADSQLNMHAGVAVSYRNAPRLSRLPWQIPGVMMGGEAHFPERGFSLDSASFGASWITPQGLWLGGEVESHHEDEMELGETYAGVIHRLNEQQKIAVRAGNLKAGFSPENQSHAHSRAFSRANLVYQAFWGDHYQDVGAQLIWQQTNHWRAGVELWQGQYPATAGKGGGMQDVYLYHQGILSGIHYEAGVWGAAAQSEQRVDDRLENGHRHGSGSVAVNDNPVAFSGDHTIYGLGSTLNWQLSDHHLSLRSEYMRTNVRGDIRDNSRISRLKGRYQGAWVQPSWAWHQHQLSARYSWVKPDNTLYGPAGPLLAAANGLESKTDAVQSTDLAYQYQWLPELAIRLEWSYDQSTRENHHYFAIGLRFFDQFQPQLGARTSYP